MGIDVERTLDIGLCLSVINNPDIWKTVSEDSASIENNIPDVVNEFWLAIYGDDQLIGVCRYHQKWKNTIQGHIMILPQFRKEYSKGVGFALIDWVLDNTEYTNIYTEVPSIYSNVINFLKSFDYVESGIIRDCYTKDQKTTDIVILTKKIR